MIRQQLPAYSPLASAKLLSAAVRAAASPVAGRRALIRILTERLGAEQAVLVSSGTHALQAALRIATSAGPWAGRPVALPAYTCYDVATAAVGAGVRVVFYDVDPASLAPDPTGVEAALRLGAGVVVAGNVYGYPLDWGALRSACDRAGALLVEDAAQGLGSAWEGREGGSFGDLTVLSLGRGKGWTGGGGGALLLRARLLAERPDATEHLDLPDPGPSASLRALVLSMAQWGLGRPWLFGLPSSIPALALGETHYKEPSAPSGMTAFSAAAAAALDSDARSEIEPRRAWAAAWREILDAGGRGSPTAFGVPRPLEGGASSYLRFPVLLTDPGRGLSSLLRMGRPFGVAAGYPEPLPSLPALRHALARPDAPSPPGATELAARLFTLPTHSRVTRRDVRGVTLLLRPDAD